MLTSSVFLVSGDIRTGKTTWLRHWMGLMKARGIQYSGVASLDSTPIGELNAAKYLQTPVQPNLHLRRMLNVETQQSIEFEIELGKEGNQSVIKVGRFVFSKKAFHQGIQWLYDGLEQESTDWLILDEVGKLELHRGEGFEPDLSQFLMKYTQTVESRKSQGKRFPHLLVVIRKELLQDFIAQHTSRLPEFEVLNFNELNLNKSFHVPELQRMHFSIHGLVLGGGQSSRMGFPKFRKVYLNHSPQWKRLAFAMQGLVDIIGINIPRKEADELENLNEMSADMSIELSWEFDEHPWENLGPIGGILSYFNRWKQLENFGLLVVAVDYPYLRDEALREIVEIHQLTKKSVFYFDDSTNIINGLIGVYSYAHLQDLERWFAEGNQSLSRFLKQKAPEIHLLTPQNWSELKSVDE
jgi:nucleoside-triphosphatase